MAVAIRRLSHGLGAEIPGIDLRAPLPESAYGDVQYVYDGPLH